MDISNKPKDNSFKFSYKNRLKKRSEFLRIQENGKKFFTTHFLIFINQTPNEIFSKFGITVSKKVDKRAVVRNKLKRRLREFFRLNKNKLSSSIQLVIIAKRNCANMDFHSIHKELSLFFYKNNFFKNNNKCGN